MWGSQLWWRDGASVRRHILASMSVVLHQQIPRLLHQYIHSSPSHSHDGTAAAIQRQPMSYPIKLMTSVLHFDIPTSNIASEYAALMDFRSTKQHVTNHS
jgi:hypothetical protein